MRLPGLALAATLAAGPAPGQQTVGCDDWRASARNLAWPYDTATRSFANGAINLIALDAGEPACCGAFLIILYPEPDAPVQACTVLTGDTARGWLRTHLDRAEALYDPARGLSVAVPIEIYNGTDGDPAILNLVVNQAEGTVRSAIAR